MDILYVAPFCHIPPLHGASQRGINLLRELSLRHSITLLTYWKQDAQSLAHWARIQGISVQWLADPPPTHQKSLYLHRLFASRPPGFASHCPDAISSAVDRSISEKGAYDVIYFATQLMGQAILVKRWPAALVLDLYDVYTPMARAKVETVPVMRPYHWLFRIEAARVKHYESSIIKQYNTILTSSEQDAQQVGMLCSEASVVVIPNGVNLPSAFETRIQQPVVLMVASYTYAPNAEGFHWFYEKVWPILCRKEPRVTVLLIGEGSETLQKLTRDEVRIHWLGKVPNLDIHYAQASCVIVPVLSGGGTRLKLIEAMAWGVPVVSTSLGAQGVNHGNDIAVADTPEQFADAVLQRITRPQDFYEEAQRARKLIADHYTWSHIGAKLLATMNDVNRDDY